MNASHPPRETRARALTMWAPVRAGLRTFLGRLADERRLRQAIRELEVFDDRRLRDIGLTRQDIEGAVRFGQRTTIDAASAPRRGDHAAAIPGADRHHVEGLAGAIEEAGRQLAATQPQPDPVSKKHTAP